MKKPLLALLSLLILSFSTAINAQSLTPEPLTNQDKKIIIKNLLSLKDKYNLSPKSSSNFSKELVSIINMPEKPPKHNLFLNMSGLKFNNVYNIRLINQQTTAQLPANKIWSLNLKTRTISLGRVSPDKEKLIVYIAYDSNRGMNVITFPKLNTSSTRFGDTINEKEILLRLSAILDTKI